MPRLHKTHILKITWLAAFLFLLIFAVAVLVLLLVTVRIQRAALTQQPTYSAKELYDTAVQQIDQGQYAQAENYLEQALQKQDDATYRNQLAVVKYRLKKYQDSIAEYQKLVDQGSDVAFAYNGMGNAYRDWADSDSTHKVEYQAKAVTAYQQAVKNTPTYVAAYSNLALLLASQGKKDQALQLLEQGIAATHEPGLTTLKTTLTSGAVANP